MTVIDILGFYACFIYAVGAGSTGFNYLLSDFAICIYNVETN